MRRIRSTSAPLDLFLGWELWTDGQCWWLLPVESISARVSASDRGRLTRGTVDPYTKPGPSWGNAEAAAHDPAQGCLLTGASAPRPSFPG